KCEVYITHTCTTVTITAEGFGTDNRIDTSITINGVQTRDSRKFNTSELVFTLDISNGNEAVDVRVKAASRSGEKIHHAQAIETFTREGCVQTPKPKTPSPSVHTSKFFGDPLVNITLTGPGH